MSGGAEAVEGQGSTLDPPKAVPLETHFFAVDFRDACPAHVVILQENPVLMDRDGGGPDQVARPLTT